MLVSNARSLPALLALLSLAVTARGQDEARSLSARFREAAARVSPAVVTVRPSVVARVEPILPLGLVRPPPTAEDATGLVLDAERGLVLTSDHVIVPGEVRVVLADGRERVASKVARDPRSDLALLTIEPEGLEGAAEWGDASSLAIGDWVLAVGQPYGFERSVSAGIVSGLRRSIGPGAADLIQTDAGIHPGNSGGPLVDLDGRVVGICVAIWSQTGGGEGIGFCVPAERARRIAEDLAEHGRVRRAFLGVRLEEPPPEQVAAEGHRPGVLVSEVIQPGPAAEAGLEPGDVILSVGGKEVSRIADLQALVEFAPIGEPLAVSVRRGEGPMELSVSPTEQPSVVVPVGVLPSPRPGLRFGPRE